MVKIIAVFIIAGSVSVDCSKIEYLHQYENSNLCQVGFENNRTSINAKCNFILSSCSKAFEEKIPFLRQGKECLKKEKYGEKIKHIRRKTSK